MTENKMPKLQRLLYLKDLLVITEASRQYHDNLQWAVSAVNNLRWEINQLELIIEGERLISKSLRAA